MSEEDTFVPTRTFWTIVTGLAILCIGAFGHSQFLDAQQRSETRQWRQEFKTDVKEQVQETKDTVKDVQKEQQIIRNELQQANQRIELKLEKLLAEQRRK
ncbi:hypothetical protein [Caudoviricetes sp.]|nr:hypothetical protein [Caudoviricetes sp.]